ncbi:MAG: tetratricopeptide repeat protein [Nannocystaceae bacterium]|nr:tetratricopeptide repeat protein [bacterium]
MSESEATPSGGSVADGLVATLPNETSGGSPAQREPEPLRRGDSVGRYTVLDRIGAGGMGVVYAAFDPQLDRRVALKVMHAGTDGPTDSAGRARLLREAQAMAKLSHPNVITVHDVGTFGERVFVAMEFIEGATLRDWMDSERAWPELVDAFVMAGRGLASAHAAGLVHRDFKPDNVLMGNDGRVLVMDFGLARQATPRTGPIGDRLEVRSASGSGPVETRDLNLNLTRTGAMLGTPAYMAPEQHRGEHIGPHADQFSFCVALYEALYRERPFEGASMASLAINVLDGHIRNPPRDTKVPSWLRAAVVRGLAVVPQDRYPSMDALLAELQRDPPQARHPWLVAGIAVGIGGLITAVYLGTRSNRLEACKEASKAIDEVWSPQRRADLQARFEDSPAPYAGATWQSTARALDNYSQAWTTVYDVRCTADAKARSRNTPKFDDPGLLCLDDRLSDVDMLLDELEVDGGVEASLGHVAAAVQTLPAPATCTSVRRSDDSDERLSAEPKRRAGLDDVHALLARGRMQVALGLPDAETTLERALARAEAIGSRRLTSEALLLEGRALLQRGDGDAAEQKLRDAILFAAQSGRADIEAAAWTLTMHVVTLRQGLYDEGRRVGLGAQAAIERAGDNPLRRAELLMSLGKSAQAEGSYDMALLQFSKALEVRTEQLQPDDVRLAETHAWLGAALEGLGRYEAASDHHKRSLAIREQVLGTSHPDVARSLLHLASSMQGHLEADPVEGTLARARMLLDPERIVDVDNLPAPADEPTVSAEIFAALEYPVELARCLDQLGTLERGQEQFDSAARLHAYAVAILERALGDNHRDVGYARVNLGLALADRRRHNEALPHLRRGLEVWTKTLPPGHADLGFAHLNLANSLWAVGQAESAREHYALAQTVWETAMGEDHPLVAFALTGRGRTVLDLGTPVDALPYLERALELRTHDDEDDLNIAEVSLLLGRALYVSGQDQMRAITLVKQARDRTGAYEPNDDAGFLAVLTGSEFERFTDQLIPAGLGVANRYRPEPE